MRSLVLIVAIVTIFTVRTAFGGKKDVTDEPQSNGSNNIAAKSESGDLEGKFPADPANGDRERRRFEKARKAFMGRGGKFRDDSDLENLKSRLRKLGDKVKKQHKGHEPKTVPYSPKYAKRRAGEPESESKTNADAELTDYLFQGDIVLTPEQLAEQEDDTPQGRRRRGATTYSLGKWPTSATGVIPYSLDSSLTAYKVTVIAAAIKFWEDNTCLKFQLNAAGANNIRFFSSTGCWSYIGMVGGQQQISIGDGCKYLGIVTHEIAHALGYYHEQSRPDRNSFVSINLANVQPDFANNFNLVNAVNNYGLTYDYGSVMHYASEDFAVNGAIPTIVATNPMFQRTMGQRKGPSFNDVRGMNLHYGCTAACANSQTTCSNGGYPDPKNCTVCKCPSGFGGALCTAVQPAENGACGGYLPASTAWSTYTASVGTPSTTDAAQTCYWHITSPVNTRIEVKVTALTGGAQCTPGCFWNAVELKINSNFQQTGIRLCCTSDLVYIYTSATNLVPLIVYGDYIISFTVQYRYVSATG